MSNFILAMTEFRKLRPSEKRLLILEALLEESVKYEDLSKAYVEYLETKNRESSSKLSKACQWITSYWDGDKMAKSAFVKAGAAYFIVNTGYLRGAITEKRMKKYLEKYPYAEDEYGFPKTELHP